MHGTRLAMSWSLLNLGKGTWWFIIPSFHPCLCLGFFHNKTLSFENSDSWSKLAECLPVPSSALDIDRTKLTRHEPPRKSGLMVLTLSEGSHQGSLFKKGDPRAPLPGMPIHLV